MKDLFYSVLAVVILYGCFAFLTLQPNPLLWDLLTRIVFTLLSGCVFALTFTEYLGKYEKF